MLSATIIAVFWANELCAKDSCASMSAELPPSPFYFSNGREEFLPTGLTFCRNTLNSEALTGPTYPVHSAIRLSPDRKILTAQQMSALTLRLICIPILLDRVPGACAIARSRHSLKMTWVDASSIVASMLNSHSFRNRLSTEMLMRKDVGIDVLLPNTKSSVTRLQRGANPKPTAIGLFDLRQEPIEDSLFERELLPKFPLFLTASKSALPALPLCLPFIKIPFSQRMTAHTYLSFPLSNPSSAIVFCPCDRLQVWRIYALPNSACMVEDIPISNRSAKVFIRETMCVYIPTVYVEPSVAFHPSGRPKPAT